MTGSARITDRYLAGTRLRLRRVEGPAGAVFKLAQKVRLAEAEPERVKITNLYLDRDEYLRLAGLPGSELLKTRRWLELSSHRIAVDDFEGRHGGLVLAEVELGDGDEALPLPAFAARDVTHDDRYSGGALAWASYDTITSLIGIG